MPNKRNPRNHHRDWPKVFAAFCISVTLFIAVLVVATRYPLAGKWISDAVQAEFAAANAPSDDKVEQPQRYQRGQMMWHPDFVRL
jgi:hypothetical protein